jgi:hypothetical protein
MMVISFVRKTLYHIYQSYLTRRTRKMATLPTRRHEDEKSKTESHKVSASAKDKDQVSHGTKNHSAQNDKAPAKADPAKDQHKPDDALAALAERFVQAKNNPGEIQRIADEVKGTVGSKPPAPGQEPMR